MCVGSTISHEFSTIDLSSLTAITAEFKTSADRKAGIAYVLRCYGAKAPIAALAKTTNNFNVDWKNGGNKIVDMEWKTTDDVTTKYSFKTVSDSVTKVTHVATDKTYKCAGQDA